MVGDYMGIPRAVCFLLFAFLFVVRAVGEFRVDGEEPDKKVDGMYGGIHGGT